MWVWWMAWLARAATVHELLYGGFVRSQRNPLERYPFRYLRLCISDPVPDFEVVGSYKCYKPLMEVSSNRMLPPQTWCTSQISNETRSFLLFLLSKGYDLVYFSGGTRASAPLGATIYSLYTHFNFVYLKTLDDFSLYKIVASNAVNVSEPYIGFTYETTFVSTPRIQQQHPVLLSFMIGMLSASVLGCIAVLFPSRFAKPLHVSISRIPNHSFILVVISGSGAGVIAFLATAAAMALRLERLKNMRWLWFLIPEIGAALASSIVTSVLCGIWNVRDVASALYFAPLLFPSLVLALLFSAQWMSVGVESCMSISLTYVLYYIVIIVFVKIPVNLIGSLLCAAVIRPTPPKTKRMSVITRRVTRDRKMYLSYANSMLFVLIFPIAQHIVGMIDTGPSGLDTTIYIVFCASWLILCIAVGVNSMSVRFEKDSDWALFAFFSTGGTGFVLWLVLNVWSVLQGHTSTLHFTLFPVLTGIACAAIGIASGTVSVISCITWMVLVGTPKHST